MGLKSDIEDEVAKIFREQWTTRDGYVIPDDTSIRLNNDAVKIKAAVLYADLDESTALVDTKGASFAAEIYKSYLVCAARIIRDAGGEITAYDGDRIMAVFIGDLKHTTAAQTALKIKWAVTNIVNPKIKAQYSSETYQINHVVGVDSSDLFVAKTGIRSITTWCGLEEQLIMLPNCLTLILISLILQILFTML